MAEPKPCPFCGHVGLYFGEGSTFRWLAYSCGGCGIGDEVRKQTSGKGTPDEWLAKAQLNAIEEWNTRAPSHAEGALADAEEVNLPELPKPGKRESRYCNVCGYMGCEEDHPRSGATGERCSNPAHIVAGPWFTAEQMRAYALASRPAAVGALTDAEQVKRLVDGVAALRTCIDHLSFHYGSHHQVVQEARAAIDRLASRPAPAAVPEGWVLVPVEPTEKMLDCGDGAAAAASTHVQRKLIAIAYRAMLAAAQPQSAGKEST